jgi:K+ transporter
MASLLTPVAGSEGVFSDLGPLLLSLIGIAWQTLLCALLVLVFVPYVGWVAVLIRARQRSDVLKGGTRGPL